MRLTAKRRVVVSSSAVQARAGIGIPDDELVDRGDGTFDRIPRAAEFDAGEDVLVTDPLDEELGKSGADTFKVLEYSYDAEPLIADKRDTVESALTRLGLTPQWVGTTTGDPNGYATSGTHYRLRMIVTDKAGRGRGRQLDRELPRILRLMAMVDSLDEANGGLGEPWNDPELEPSVARPNAVPPDEVETAQVEATLVTAGARSIETSVRAQHPDWRGEDGEELVKAEVDRIKAERGAAPAGMGGGGF
jgi:hypothetical protein